MAENIVLVGNKPVMNYVLAVVTQMKNNNLVILKARGRTINRAVDVAEIVRNKFIPDAKISNIKIATEELENKDLSQTNVSTIEIHILKE
ncbi:MAG: DNA-binding protein Alba [Methanobrevibacter sp.]|jgi:DNA-binding protein|nr:DNA-binding protein Alba [Candidatus Methanoflexus mossambicus]